MSKIKELNNFINNIVKTKTGDFNYKELWSVKFENLLSIVNIIKTDFKYEENIEIIFKLYRIINLKTAGYLQNQALLN